MLRPLPNPLPVSFGPHEADWWMVVVSAVAALASIAVAIVAVRTASEARRISAQTEKERMVADKRREELAYAQRLDDSIVRLFQAIGDHFGPLRKWMDDADDVEIHNRTDERGDLLYPQHPEMDSIDSNTEAVRVIARGADGDVAKQLAYSIALVHNASGRQRWIHLKAIMQVVRQWRSGEIPGASALAFFKEFQTVNDPK